MTNIPLSISANKYYPYTAGTGVQPCADPRACKLKVEGKGYAKVQPDIAVVSLGVVTENKQLRTAQEENSATMNEVIKTLKAMGVPDKDIQTQAYNIAPQYDFIEGKQVFRGYRVEHILEVTIRDTTRIGAIIDAAVQSGANQINGIRFSVSNPAEYYQRALNAAVDDALAKAKTLGNKLNIAVSPIPVQIIEESYESAVPLGTTMYQAAPAAPIQTGQIEIAARIEALFVYRPVYGPTN